MYRTLMVPLDGSPFGEHALPLALAIARRAKARIRLVHVVMPLVEPFAEGIFLAPVDVMAYEVRQKTAYLEGVAERLRAQATVEVTTSVLEGEVASTLQADAEKGPADLVVMATHGRGAMGRFWLGSVADELVRHLSLPLLLVRPHEPPPDLAKEADLAHVLLPLDGTDLAEQVLPAATELACLMPAAEVTLVRVVKPTTASYYPSEGAVDDEERKLLNQVRALQERLYREAEDYLEKVAGRLRARGLKVRTRVAVEAHPALAILHEAKYEHSGLIALATHGRRGLSRLMMGSIADKVVRGAEVPVLVLRPK
jgi:nucleotide-binding universal stress UspA family protein